ncbi:MAG: hypothetical protein KGH75_04525 [Rhodospirillales bacterium]|nr:hypothetical protein [Rhodospirillales bacterium]
MALTPITITFGEGAAPVTYPDGSTASGALTFTLVDPTTGLPETISDSVTGETVEPLPIVGQVHDGVLQALPVGAGPYTPLVLLANDDPTTVPTSSVYLVHEELVAGSKPDWHFIVHYNAVGATQSIVSQRPA